MRSNLRRPAAILLVAATVLTATPIAFAGLSALPKSHVQAMPDGKHMLVFLAPGPVADDEGRIGTLPDGRVVDLRTTYPASGYYSLESTQPIWTAPWDDSDGWTVSDDGRFLVRWNIFGVGQYGRGGRLSWGLKFYDRGKEIRTYDVGELVDYPSLMPYTSSNWHLDWTGDEVPRIQNGVFHFETSTHEAYDFDLATGTIVMERRPWRTATRVATATIAILSTGLIFALLRRRRRRLAYRAEGRQNEIPADGVCAAGWQPGRLLNHNLRTELMITTSVAALCYVAIRWPHVAVFVVTLIAAAGLSYLTVRYWRRSGRLPISQSRRIAGIGARFAMAFTAAIVFYVLTVGPVFRLTQQLESSDDVRKAIFLTVYRPITWIPDEVLRKIPLLEWYFEEWQDT